MPCKARPVGASFAPAFRLCKGAPNVLIAIAIFAAAASPPRSAQPAESDPVICRRQQSEVGTHMRAKPVCMKRSDWDYVDKNTQNELTTLKDRSSFDPGKADGHRPQ